MRLSMSGRCTLYDCIDVLEINISMRMTDVRLIDKLIILWYNEIKREGIIMSWPIACLVFAGCCAFVAFCLCLCIISKKGE